MGGIGRCGGASKASEAEATSVNSPVCKALSYAESAPDAAQEAARLLGFLEKPERPEPMRFLAHAAAGEARDEEDRHVTEQLPQAARDRDAVGPGQLDVHQHQIRMQPSDLAHNLRAVRRAAADLHVRSVVDQRTQPGDEKPMVVDDVDPFAAGGRSRRAGVALRPFMRSAPSGSVGMWGECHGVPIGSAKHARKPIGVSLVARYNAG